MKKTVLFLIALFFFIGFGFLYMRKTRSPEQAYPIPRHIQYGFTLQNRTDQVVRNVLFLTYAPVKQTSTQLCKSIESSHPYLLQEDALGNRIMQFAFDEFPPYATKIIRVQSELALASVPNILPETKTDPFVMPQKYCESDNDRILAAAKGLNDPLPSKTVENIFRWVSENIRYTGYTKNPRGALYALNEKKGDCTEYMYLFAALCRASHIPARCISGYVCSRSKVLQPNEYHNWAEFYNDGTWQLSDPQNKTFMQDTANYIAMKIIAESASPDMEFNRIRVVGSGIHAKMN